MKIKVHMRKGDGNKKFAAIVSDISHALEQIPTEGRIKLRLLSALKEKKANMAAAWQDGDELYNIFGKNYDYRFDLYNWETKTAVEIEESEVKYIWKDLVKLAIGARRGRVDHAIFICPLFYKGKALKKPIQIHAQAIVISKFMSDFLWMKNLAIIGYDKYDGQPVKG